MAKIYDLTTRKVVPTEIDIDEYEDIQPIYDTKEGFIDYNKANWAEQGRLHKEQRLAECYTLAELAEYLGVSATKLRNFESGKPVIHARLLGMAYEMFFKLYSAKAISKSMKEDA